MGAALLEINEELCSRANDLWEAIKAGPHSEARVNKWRCISTAGKAVAQAIEHLRWEAQ